jgi:VWFA-related protein
MVFGAGLCGVALLAIVLAAQAQDRPSAAVPLSNDNNTPNPSAIPGARRNAVAPGSAAVPGNALPPASSATSSAAAPAATPPSQTPVEMPDDLDGAARISTTVRIVMAPTTVTTKDGGIVTGLTPSDFRLYDNGKLQRITEDVTNHPLSLVVAIQNSYQLEKVLPQIQKISSLLEAQVLGEDGEVSLITFSNKVETATDFTSDAGKIDKALKAIKLSFNGQAHLNDATVQAVRMLRNRPTSRRRAILLISESRDEGSSIRAREVLNAAEFANVVIYSVDVSHLVTSLTKKDPPPIVDTRPPGAIPLPGGNVATPTSQAQNAMGNWVPVFKEIFIAAKAVFVSNPLEVYTTYTGGREYNFKTQGELDRAINALGEEIHSQYLLTYTPNNLDEAGFHNIVVQVARPDMKVRTRDGYYFGGTGKQ